MPWAFCWFCCLPEQRAVCGPDFVGWAAPCLPLHIHETPDNFGRELSMSMTGLQMAFAYVGSCLAPPLFGLLAQNVTPGCTPGT